MVSGIFFLNIRRFAALAQCLKKGTKKALIIIAQTHYTVIFSIYLNRNREVSRGGYGRVTDVIFLVFLFFISPAAVSV
jgi:hypothetical protein